MDGAHGGDGMGRQRDIEEGFWECCEEENKKHIVRGSIAVSRDIDSDRMMEG